MKKVMGLLFFVGLLSGCDSDSAPSPRLWIQVPEIPVAVTANYSLSDINIDIYSSKDNYVNEVNPVYEGKLNSEGTIELNEGIESGVLYYVDIYTDDNVISNWSPSSGAFSSDPLESVSYESNEFSGIPITVFLVTNTKAFLGEWSFLVIMNNLIVTVLMIEQKEPNWLYVKIFQQNLSRHLTEFHTV